MPCSAAADLDRLFASIRRQRRAALAIYYPVGFPTREQSLETLHLLAATADVLELGLPYSDPMMDGPTIQQATHQALTAGFRVAHLFSTLRELRASTTAALLVMTYWQPVARFGPERFAAELAHAGAAGAIIPDLPLEEATPWLNAARAHHLHTVPVVAPNATADRLARICTTAGGMIYAPAAAGVTGHTGPLDSGLPAFVARLRTLTHLPISVGIGISDTEQARQAAQYADGVIVGSALIRRIQSTPGASGVRSALDLAHDLARGVRRLQSAA
ncbi:tryptophan synthase subunit alpha [Streptomyces chryseus]